MSKPMWRYSVTIGLSGCDMPNATSGPYWGTTRNALVAFIRDEINAYAGGEGGPSQLALLRQVKINNLWHHIKRHGSSSAHFRIAIGNGEEIAFHGLTEDEFKQQEADAHQI